MCLTTLDVEKLLRVPKHLQIVTGTFRSFYCLGPMPFYLRLNTFHQCAFRLSSRRMCKRDSGYMSSIARSVIIDMCFDDRYTDMDDAIYCARICATFDWYVSMDFIGLASSSAHIHIFFYNDYNARNFLFYMRAARSVSSTTNEDENVYFSIPSST